LDATLRLAAELDDRSVPMSLLVNPKRQSAEPAVLDWLRARATGAHGTDALALHGMTAPDRGARRTYPRWTTAAGLTNALRGPEFAVLPAHEAGLKLLAARAMLHHLGLPTESFAPPNWVASPGTLSALRRHGFRLCAELRGVRDLLGGSVRAGRVLGFGPGRQAEHWWCAALVLGAGRIARRGGLVRLAVDAADLTRAGVAVAVRDAVDISLHHGATPLTYADLAGSAIPAPRRGGGGTGGAGQTSVASPAVSGLSGATSLVKFSSQL
jgi:predicted deacetylase